MITKLLIVDKDSPAELLKTAERLKRDDVEIITFELSGGFIEPHTGKNLFVENIMKHIRILSETDAVNLTNIGFIYSKQDSGSAYSNGYVNTSHIIAEIQNHVDDLSSWDYLVSTSKQLHLVTLIKSLDLIDINHFLYSQHYSTIFNYINSKVRTSEDGIRLNYLENSFDQDTISDELYHTNNWLCSMLTTFYSDDIKTLMDKYFHSTHVILEEAKTFSLKVDIKIRYIFSDANDESGHIIRNVILYDLHMSNYLEDVGKTLLPNTAIITFSKKNTFEEIKQALKSLSDDENVEITNVALFQNNTQQKYYNIVGEEKSIVGNVVTQDPSLNTWSKFTDFILFLEKELHVDYFDLLMCKIYSDVNWRYVIDHITSQLDKLETRSSEDITGHIIFDGDWILESPATDVNLIGLYFDETITNIDVHLNGSYKFTSKALLLVAIGEWIDNSTTDYGDINTWDTSDITDMSELFRGRSTFNDDIGLWNTSNVTRMAYMFHSCGSFNQDIETKPNQVDSNGNSYTAWDMSNVTDVGHMFFNGDSFNTSINNWDVGNVVTFEWMFYHTGNNCYNQPLDNWDTSKGTNFRYMFGYSSFNQDISSWDVGNSDKFDGMFTRNSAFNQDLSTWSIKSTANLQNMFSNASSFNQVLDGYYWTTHTGVQTGMFGGSSGYIPVTLTLDANGRISSADLYTAVMNWSSQKTSIISQIGDISTWDTSDITDMSELFRGLSTFNEDIGLWNTSNVTRMAYMFHSCGSFNQDIETKPNQVDSNGNSYTAWDMSNVTDVGHMFFNGHSFNTSINNWDVGNVVTFEWMFYHTGDNCYNQPLDNWDTSKGTNFRYMFGYSSFNQDISSWDVGNSDKFDGMFTRNSVFNQDLSTWSIKSTANLQNMFSNASSFNQVLDGYYWTTHTGDQTGMFGGSSGSIGTLPDSPTLTISSTDLSVGDSSSYGIINMNITSTTSITILDTDISLSNGVISEFTKNSGTSYTFKVSSNSTTQPTSLTILENSLQNDSIGAKYNEPSNVFQWTWDYNVVPPDILISSVDVSNGGNHAVSSVNMELEILNDVLQNNTVETTILPVDFDVVNGFVYGIEANDSTENYLVKVSGKTNNHPNYNSGSASGFYLSSDGGANFIESPELDFLVGNTYAFDVSDSTNTGHPLLFYEDDSKTVPYVTNVTTSGTAGSPGANVTIKITKDTPSILYYHCGNHAGMGYIGNIKNIIKFKLGATTTTSDTTVTIPQNTLTRVFNDTLTLKSNNASNSFTWNYDSPILTITSLIINDTVGSNLVSAANTSANQLWLQFTFSESIFNIDKDNFIVSDCKIKNISFDTSFKICTVNVETFYTTSASIEVRTDTQITTGRGIEKLLTSSADTSFNWNYSSDKPEISLSASQVSGLTNNSSFVDLSFVTTLDTDDFDVSSITITGDASLSNFVVISGSEYSVRLTPNNASTINIAVATSSFTDNVYGNENSNSVSFDWIYDNVPPTVTITSPTIADGESSSDPYIELNFTMSKPVTDFVLSDDLDVVNGTIGSLTRLTDSLYTTKLYPTQNDTVTVTVLSNAITDSAGNKNAYDSNVFDWVFTSTDLLATLASNEIINGESYANNSITMTLTTSLDIVDFVNADIVCTNGTVTNVDNAAKTFTVTSDSANSETTIKIPSGSVQTIQGVNNIESNTFAWTYAPPIPTLSIESSQINVNDYTNISPIDITLTFDQSDVIFDQTNLDVSNGTITSFGGSGATYQVSITPSIDQGTIRLSLPENQAHVVSNGNHYNDVSYNYEWNYDSIAPSVTISSNFVVQDASSSLTKTNLTITSDKNTSGLSLSDFDVSNAVVSNLSDTSGTSFTVTIEPFDEQVDCSINVSLKAGAVVDSAGNTNSKSNDFEYSYIFFSRKLESSAIVNLFENDAEIPESEKLSSSEIDLVISAAFTIPDTSSPFESSSDPEESSVVKPPKITIPSEVSIVNRKVFTRLIDQIFASTSDSVTSLTIDKSSMAVSAAAETELAEIEEVVMVKSNQTEPIVLSSFTEDAAAPSAAYIPLANAGDFAIVEISGVEYTTVANGDDTFTLSDNISGGLGTFSTNDTYTISDRHKIIFGSETIVDGGEETDPGTGESESSSSGIPCFLEGTQILTTKGYKNIEHLNPKKDKLLDKDNNPLTFMDIQKYSQDNNGKYYPYKIPNGSALSEHYKCNRDLYLTYNHCVYLPHLNKYAPVSAMKHIEKDKTLPQTKFTYYHIFTENYFSDTIMANGIPCESHSRYTFAKLRNIDPSGKLLTDVIKKADMLPNCMRSRLSVKEIKRIVKKHQPKTTRIKKHQQRKK